MAKLLFMVTHGSDDPTRAGLPFHLAIGSREEGVECCLVLIAEGVYLMKESVVNSIVPIGFPPLKELMEGVKTRGVPIYV